MDWTTMFELDPPALEMVLRGTLIYWFLLLVFRYLLRRDVGSMSMADLLFVVLVADAASNGMQDDYRSVSNALVLLGTLVAWNLLLDWLAYRSPAVARLLEAPPALLVRHGRVVMRTLRRELITLEELRAKLREQGVDDLSEIRVARLESDGKVSVIKRR